MDTGCTCWRCGKIIKGKITMTNPPIYMLRLGINPRAFHPACYEREEKEAEQKLMMTA